MEFPDLTSDLILFRNAKRPRRSLAPTMSSSLRIVQHKVDLVSCEGALAAARRPPWVRGGELARVMGMGEGEGAKIFAR